MRRHGWWRVVPFAFVGMAAAVVAAGGMQQCGGGIALEYVVVVNTTDPLGMLLSDKLHVLSFVQDENGRDRVIEASGLVEVGDVLVGVNDLLTDGTALSLVVDWIREADVPKKLTFRAHNSTRCIPLDHVQVASQGDQQSTRMYALASEFGDVIACELYPIVLADPAHACVPLNNNVTGLYLAELAASATATAPAAIQVVVSDTCADRFRDPTVVAMTMSEKHALLVEATSGDLTIVTQDGPRTAEMAKLVEGGAKGVLWSVENANVPLAVVTSVNIPITGAADSTLAIPCVFVSGQTFDLIRYPPMPTQNSLKGYTVLFIFCVYTILFWYHRLCAEDGPVSIAFAANSTTFGILFDIA
ncbi:hypothetical protein B5M09_011231 [Aphanomyces astaci]|uniref:PDZ domain-containing protein n=1 Tax=Aphanomyces astaci TaxID=112090 RepID=A0A3R7Y371_APHAT|nr:hypothetical protein B5M09_011231 [Aphanomyces astaci]